MIEIEQILTGGNLLRAMHQVQKNQGSAGFVENISEPLERTSRFQLEIICRFKSKRFAN
jgi:hypothetical protein